MTHGPIPRDGSMESRTVYFLHDMQRNSKPIQKPIDPVPAEPSECAICLRNIITNDDTKKLECNHTFHRVCIAEWYVVQPRCPLCRRFIPLSNQILPDRVRYRLIA